MTEAEFSARMNEFDQEFASLGTPVPIRSMQAVYAFWGSKEFKAIISQRSPRNPNIGPYEGSNLHWAIHDWYMKRYYHQMIVGSLGERLIPIRAQVFRVKLPAIFSPKEEIPAFEYIEGFSPELLAILSEEERRVVQQKFSAMFNHASHLARLSVRINLLKGKNANLASDLIKRGLTDLHASVTAFVQRDPGANIWSAQQAAEKFLKAFLCVQDDRLDERLLKDTFGHDLKKLLFAASKIADVFSKAEPHIQRLNISPADRYKFNERSPSEAVELIDISFWIANSVAEILLPHLD
jgi:HEPN domain-containing protein